MALLHGSSRMSIDKASLFTARDFGELQDHLRAISVEVPFHPKERLNAHVETYALVSLLSSIPWDSSCFPMDVFRRERPDFYLRCGSSEIGLEHTEGMNQNLAKERALRADGHGPEVHYVSTASVHDPARSSGEILDDIVADEPGDGWCGDSVERNWAEAMAYFINKKAASAKKNGYQLYGDDRLMIYDNWPAPGLKHQRALPYLRTELKGSEAFTVFRRVYIIDESTILEISAERSIYHNVLGRPETEQFDEADTDSMSVAPQEEGTA
jgi:hypothetical protein